MNRWRWVDIEEARKNKVKGFPKLEEKPDASTEGAEGLWRLAEAPEDIGDLRAPPQKGPYIAP